MNQPKPAQRAVDLPRPGKKGMGKYVHVPLQLWGEYKALHGLEVAEVKFEDGRLYVGVQPAQEVNDEG
jgi:hypothetical protein